MPLFTHTGTVDLNSHDSQNRSQLGGVLRPTNQPRHDHVGNANPVNQAARRHTTARGEHGRRHALRTPPRPRADRTAPGQHMARCTSSSVVIVELQDSHYSSPLEAIPRAISHLAELSYHI